MKIVRFWGATLAIVAAGLLTCLWFQLDGDLFGLATDAQRLRASLVVAGVCLMLLVAKDAFMPMWRRRQNKAQQPLRPSSGTSGQLAPAKHAGLLSLCSELRVAHGPFWRYRLCWLMLEGSDPRIEEVVPGLKRCGVMHVGNAVLLHASPEGIEAKTWRSQIRRLRRRRPVDGVVHVIRADESDTELPRTLAGLATDLGWAAPVTFLHAVPAQGNQPDTFDAIGAFPGPALKGAQPAGALRDQLAAIERHTADAGVRLCTAPTRITYLAQVSQYIGQQRTHIVAGWETLLASPWLRAPLAGVMFAPVFATPATAPARVPLAANAAGQPGSEARPAAPANEPVTFAPQPASLRPVWHTIARRRGTGRRVGVDWPNALALFVTVGAIAWCAWLAVSFIGNQQLMHDARATADAALDARPRTAPAWRAQLALQQLIGTLEYRQQHGAPWYLRAGLSRNDAVLAALWPSYRIAATRNLQAPVVSALEATLRIADEARADSLQPAQARDGSYDALKAYLMLVEPRRTDAGFLTRVLAAQWPGPAGMPAGERDDTGRRLAGFYADHLKAHPDWRIAPDDRLVTATRAMLVTQRGLASADDTVYQGLLDAAQGKYADASLDTLLGGTDARGLFSAAQTVPGLYTRAAWDGMIAEAIDRASSARHISGDWVLTGSQPAPAVGNPLAQGVAAIDEQRAADALKQRLTARYFADYTAAWQRMLNSVRWQPASNLNGAIEQLARLADAQTSPLIALMKAVQFHAQAGRPSQALTDTLVRKAQGLIGGSAPSDAPAVHPLDPPFGPLLALMGDTADGKGGAPVNVALTGVSLSRYLTAVTTMRLKLQQIAASADAQSTARALAQAVFQGKLSELSQARDDAALTAASLGAAWSGFGDAAFAQPLEGAWQTILQPAAASLNDAWRASVAAPFNAAMAGRYPFFDTPADASFAELGRYVRPDTGLIARFMTTQLAGVIKLQGNHWTPNALAPQALRFDPAFVAGVRQLSTVGAQLYGQGDAGEKFALMALPTPTVTRSELSVDGRRIVYFNQQESWTPLAWPGDGLNGHARLTWQTLDAGVRQAFDATGDWAFLRLLSQADVKPLDGTRYRLTWNAAHGEPLSYVLRTQLGADPLELLKLRGFRMPERIFVVGTGGAMPSGVPGLPPLPPEWMP